MRKTLKAERPPALRSTGPSSIDVRGQAPNARALFAERDSTASARAGRASSGAGVRAGNAHQRVMAGTFDYGAAWAHVTAATFNDNPEAFTIGSNRREDIARDLATITSGERRDWTDDGRAAG